MPESTRPARARRWPLAIALLLLGSLGIAAVWILVADARNAQSSWMAVVAAVDAAWILRLTRARPGMLRALAGLSADQRWQALYGGNGADYALVQVH